MEVFLSDSFNSGSASPSLDVASPYSCGSFSGREVINVREENSDAFRVSDSSASDIGLILSVYWRRGKLGAAYFTVDDGELHILNDCTDVHPDFNNLRTLLNQVHFSQVITCSNLADSFNKTLRELVDGNELDSSESNHENGKLHFMPGTRKDLNYESCKRFILGYHFGFEPEFANEEDRLLYINTQFELKNESMVMSLGTLLKYLDKYIPQINLSHEGPRVTSLHGVCLENSVSVDESTYKALQIFNVMFHPSPFKRCNSSSNREGLSVFAIFNRCRTKMGVRRMRQIFTNPTKNIDELNLRYEAIGFCCKPQHEHIVKNMVDCIKKVDSVTGILANIYRARSNMNHWKSLYSSLYNAIAVAQICSSYTAHSQLFKKVADSITKNVQEVAHAINSIVDFEESFLRNQFTVRAGIDTRLDKIRQTYTKVPEVLVKVAELELKDLPEYIEKCSIVYITELGYLLSVPIWKGDGSNTKDYEYPNFEVKFILNQFVHYKTPRCDELDNVLGDVLAKMCSIESKIMISLIQFIHDRVPDITYVMKLIAELDCIIAMAATALENNYTRPEMTKERRLEILKGRHPLQELCMENFVHNNAIFNLENGVVKILTGPNASGKSVYLKQVALIAFLAHIGSFVPAERAVIGILDHIHARIHAVGSISTRMSAFVLDLKQMSHALYNSTPLSLIIIDEFGKGTTEIDGLSLLAASLIHFIQRDENCPFILVSTHFHRLPELLPNSPLVTLQFMDYLIENDDIVYLHKLKNGICSSSLAHLAAKKAGLGEKSIQRFLELQDCFRNENPLKHNPHLQITKRMLRDVNEVTNSLRSLDENEEQSRE